MKKSNYEEILNATSRHLAKRNCTDSGILKKTNLKLKQSTDQFENSPCFGHQKIISLQNFNFTELEADSQYNRLKTWVESLEINYRLELEDLLFPTFISLYRKLNLSGNANGARNFSSRNQSNFFKTPELISMAESFCSESNSCFILELSEESFDLLTKFVANSENPLLQHLLNTSLEVNILKRKIETDDCSSEKRLNMDILNNAEELQELTNAMNRLEELPPVSPLLKMYAIDTGQRKMCTSCISICQRYLCCGFQDSSVALWDLSKASSPNRSRNNNLDLACAIGFYHPYNSILRTESEPTDAEPNPRMCIGHSGPVYSTKFTPSNTHVLSASEDTSIRLWEVESLENVVVFRGHTYPVWALDISPQGQYFVSASKDRTAKVWTFERTYPVRILAGHTADVDGVAFHPNGLYIATGSADSSIRMWSVTDGKPVRILVGHRGSVLSVCFSPCGKLLASAGEDRLVKVWDIAAGALLFDFIGHKDTVHNLVWLSEKMLGSCSADGSVRIWEVAGNAENSCKPPPVASTSHQISSYSVPSPLKIVHLGRGQRAGLVCVASSD